MRKILLFLALIFCAPVAFGQGGGFIPLQTATNVLTGRPIANATITVCASATLGSPCNPPLANAIFSDIALSKPLPNPFLADNNGNYQFAAAVGTYTVSVTAQGFNGYSYQVTVPSTSPGAVQSVFGRSGTVTPQSGDYSCTQVLNCTPNTTTVAGHFLSSNVSIACGDLTNAGPGCSSTSGITLVSSLPATCTAGTTLPVEITVSISVGVPGVTYGPGTIFYCDSTNHFTPVSQGSGASPIMGFYLSNQCPPANNAQCFFTPGNTQQAVDCTWTSGSNSVTCGSSHFVAADVGKQVMGWASCNAEQSFTSNATAKALVNGGVGSRPMTIASFVSATSITVSVNADNTASGNTNCFVWGTPDDAGASAVDTAMQSAPGCPKLFIAAAYYWFNQPHFFGQPTGCNQLGTIYQGAQANTVYAAGFEIEGRGTGNTVIFLANDFPESPGACNHGTSTTACFVRTQNGRWHDFQITGGQNALGTGAGNNLIEVAGPGSLDNITCTNFGYATTTLVGMLEYYWDRWYQVNNSGCGYIATATSSSQISQLVIYKYRAENNATGLLHRNTGDVWCQDCGFLGSDAPGLVSAGWVQNVGGGVITLYGGFGQFSAITNATGQVGYLAGTTAGATLISSETRFGNALGTNFTSIKCTVTCTTTLFRTVLTATGTGNTINDGVSTSQTWDHGGNTFYNGGAGPSISGAVYGSSSISLTPLVTGNVSITSCGTSTAGTFLGSSQKGQFTITFAGTPGTTCTATVTFPRAFLIAPVCTWYNQGGTNALATTITQGSVATATSTTATFSGPTFTNTNTLIVQYQCQNP